MFLTILILATLLMLMFHLLHRKLDYWKQRRVPGPNPHPLVGAFGDMLIGRRGVNQIYSDIYRKYEGYPFVGVYRFTKPVLLVRDPDLIRCILLTEFNSFRKNDIYVDRNEEPIFSRNPFITEGEEWKARRAYMTSCMSPLKIKDMYRTMDQNSRNMVDYIVRKKSRCDDIMKIFEKFLVDNIAACGLGIQSNCFIEDKSAVAELINEILLTEGIDIFLIAFWMNIPEFSKIISFRVYKKKIEDNFLSMIRSSLKYRKDENISVNDYFHGATQIKRGDVDYDIAAIISSLITDGFQSTVNVMAFLIFELALNENIQDRLREEVSECFDGNGGRFAYEETMKLPYLDACLQESMRKHPIITVLSKECTKHFTYTSTNPEYRNMSVTMDPGTSVAIPAYAIHHDPKFFDEPEKFMPERFLDPNINKYTYFGFGIGHRKCVGARFAMTQMKIGIAHFINNFEVRPNPRTTAPLKYDPWYFVLTVRDGIWIEIRSIQDKI